MRRRSAGPALVAVVAALAAAVHAGPAAAETPRLVRPAEAGIPVPPAAWLLPPTGYRYQAAVGCADDDKGARYRQPVRAAYEVCADQMQLLVAALEKARTAGRLLIVEIGGTWCSWCGSLQRQIATPELLGWTGEPLDFTKTFEHVKIGVSTTYKGEREDIPSGNVVVALLMRHAPPGARFRALPYILVVDPTSTEKVFARNLGDLPTAEPGRYDPAALRAVLIGAHDYLRKGGPAPTEPGWLQRQLQRLFRG